MIDSRQKKTWVHVVLHMFYFQQDDYNAILSIDTSHADDPQRVHRKLVQLHRDLYPRLKQHGIDVHPNASVPGGVFVGSCASPFASPAMTLTYMRAASEASVVERIMGREISSVEEINCRLHPSIEIRVMPDSFAVELLLAPDAWYDQQNFSGKLSIQQHRLGFSRLLYDLAEDFCMGFWSGIYLTDMHLTTDKLPPAKILLEYLDTFAAGRDYLRIGRWYEPDDPVLDEEHITAEIFQRIRELYTIYDFIVWTSNNNFHGFYKKAAARS